MSDARPALLHAAGPLMAAVPLPAATVVLMRDREPGQGRPEVLLVERNRASAFGAGAYVFPGGVVEPQDVAPAAAALSPRLTPAQAHTRLEAADSPGQALGFYVAAIRETFEEALVLLAEPACAGAGAAALPATRPATRPGRAALEAVRARLLTGELHFLDWLATAGLCLDTERLVYFAHWITPEAVPHRYAARFFLIRAPQDAEVVTDGHEVLRHRWLEPAQAIALRRQGDIHLMDPTVRNLELLGSFASTEEALLQLNRREVRAILPKLRLHEDGSRTVIYPWDTEYDRA
jgi:8-oxo-dGTP pyrophosphatase MutT (NUDIX family)